MRAPTTLKQDYLWWAVACSALVHALLIFWPSPQAPAHHTDSLNISLVNYSTQEAPLHPDIKAQANLDAGGDQEWGQLSSPLPYSALDPNELVLRAMKARQYNLEATQQRLLSQLQAQSHVPVNTPQLDDTAYARQGGEEQFEQAELRAQDQLARIEKDISRYQQQPRYHYIAPSALAAPEAAYVENWRIRVENTGTEHYPKSDKLPIHGSLQMSVYLRRDGSVLKTQVNQASEHPALNLAAQRIVQLAAPFAAVPSEVAPDTDILVITRYWHFTQGGLYTQSSP